LSILGLQRDRPCQKNGVDSVKFAWPRSIMNA
jgi:hypothetical protein